MDSGPFKGLLIPHNACNHLPNPPAAVSPCIRLKCLPLSPISQQAISPSTLDSAPFFFCLFFFCRGSPHVAMTELKVTLSLRYVKKLMKDLNHKQS